MRSNKWKKKKNKNNNGKTTAEPHGIFVTGSIYVSFDCDSQNEFKEKSKTKKSKKNKKYKILKSAKQSVFNEGWR